MCVCLVVNPSVFVFIKHILRKIFKEMSDFTSIIRFMLALNGLIDVCTTECRSFKSSICVLLFSAEAK